MPRTFGPPSHGIEMVCRSWLLLVALAALWVSCGACGALIVFPRPTHDQARPRPLWTRVLSSQRPCRHISRSWFLSLACFFGVVLEVLWPRAPCDFLAPWSVCCGCWAASLVTSCVALPNPVRSGCSWRIACAPARQTAHRSSDALVGESPHRLRKCLCCKLRYSACGLHGAPGMPLRFAARQMVAHASFSQQTVNLRFRASCLKVLGFGLRRTRRPQASHQPVLGARLALGVCWACRSRASHQRLRDARLGLGCGARPASRSHTSHERVLVARLGFGLEVCSTCRSRISYQRILGATLVFGFGAQGAPSQPLARIAPANP